MNEAEYINAKMNPEDSIVLSETTYETMAKTVAEHIGKNRKSAEVKWRPFIIQKAFEFKNYGADLHFNAKEYYPESQEGDVVYAACNIKAEVDCELWMHVSGAVKVFYKDECLFSSWEEASQLVESKESKRFSINVKANELAHLVIKTVCTKENFGFVFNISVPSSPGMWPRYYLVMARVQMPIVNMEKEEGFAISPLYKGAASAKEGYETPYDFENKEVFAFPEIEEEGNVFDFNSIYEKGNSAVTCTFAEKTGYISIQAESDIHVVINGEKVLRIAGGETVTVSLRKGDKVLMISFRDRKGWGFKLLSFDGIGIPMLDTDRRNDFKLMFCGPFYQEGKENKLPPEYAEDIFRPFNDGNGNTVFWRFINCDIKAYIDTSFSGQWYYAAMLGYYGIYNCSKTLDLPSYMEYFLSNERFMTEQYDYAKYSIVNYEQTGIAPLAFMVGAPTDFLLDNNGTMGVNFIAAYQETGDIRYLSMIYKLRNNIQNKVARFPDGTFCRKAHGTMWADDFYMSVPFLAHLYSQMGEESALDDILAQIRGFKKRLYMPEERIFSHIFFLDKNEINRIPWARGNGWIAFGLSEALMLIPKESKAFQEGVELFREFCEGLADFQDESGMWHQVLNCPDSYLETSGSSMITLAFYRGIRYGWLPEKFRALADRALQTILSGYVDKDGFIYGVSKGSGCSTNVDYYKNLPSIKDDSHGLGVLLVLLCEKIREKREEQSSMNYNTENSSAGLLSYKTLERKMKDESIFSASQAELLCLNIEKGNYKQAEEIVDGEFFLKSNEKGNSLAVAWQLAREIFTNVHDLMFLHGVSMEKEFKTFVDYIDKIEYHHDRDEITSTIKKLVYNTCKRIAEQRCSLDLVEQVICHIGKNYKDKNLCLQSIAAEFNVNNEYLSKKFKEKTEIRLVDYVNILRIERAIRLMLKKECLLADVPEKVGFASYRTFSRIFAGLTGVSPKVFMKK